MCQGILTPTHDTSLCRCKQPCRLYRTSLSGTQWNKNACNFSVKHTLASLWNTIYDLSSHQNHFYWSNVSGEALITCFYAWHHLTSGKLVITCYVYLLLRIWSYCSHRSVETWKKCLNIAVTSMRLVYGVMVVHIWCRTGSSSRAFVWWTLGGSVNSTATWALGRL